MRILVFIILFLTSATYSFAAPCYGTSLPKEKKIFLGVQDYTIFKRYLENDFGKVRSMQIFLLLSYGVFDWLSVDLKGGVGNIKQHPLGSDEIDYPSSFNGGYGFRVKAYENKNLKFVYGFQHISVHPKMVYLGNVPNQAILDDWQVSFLASYNFQKVTPYLGAKLSRMDYIHRVDGNRKRRMSDLTKSWGAVLGFDLPLTEKIWINLEGQAQDATTAAFSLNYSF